MSPGSLFLLFLMSEVECQSIFDPLMTSPIQRKGTRLGLSLAYHLVTDKHQGKIKYFSTLGVGTEFLITIPLKSNPSVIGNK